MKIIKKYLNILLLTIMLFSHIITFAENVNTNNDGYAVSSDGKVKVINLSDKDKQYINNIQVNPMNKREAKGEVKQFNKDAGSRVKDLRNERNELSQEFESYKGLSDAAKGKRLDDESREIKQGFNGFYKTSENIAKMNSAFGSIRVAIYVTIINAIIELTAKCGEKISLFMTLFVAAMVTLQLIWNGFKYYVDISQQEQDINIGAFVSQQMPYICKALFIAVLLGTNLYWWLYSVVFKQLFVLLGGTIAGNMGVTFEVLVYKMVELVWLPGKILIQAAILALLLIPLITMKFWILFIFGLMLLFIVGKSLAEFVLIIIEYFIVGIFSIIVIPLSLLNITSNYGGRMIGGMLAAGINLLVGTMLMIFCVDRIAGDDITFWNILFNWQLVCRAMLHLFIFLVLLQKAKTVGNFIVNGKGVQVKGSEVVGEGIRCAYEAISLIVTIATIVASAGAGSVATAGAKAAQKTAEKAAQKAAQKVVEKVAKKAVEKVAKQAGKQLGKGVATKAVKKGAEETSKKAAKSLMKRLQDGLQKAASRKMKTKAVGQMIQKAQQNEGLQVRDFVGTMTRLAGQNKMMNSVMNAANKAKNKVDDTLDKANGESNGGNTTDE